VVVGEGEHEASTAIVWGVGMSHESDDNVAAELCKRSKAIRAAPLRELLTPYGGRLRAGNVGAAHRAIA